MARRERRRFSDEYKAEVVALIRSSGKGITTICRDLNLTETTVREWSSERISTAARGTV